MTCRAIIFTLGLIVAICTSNAAIASEQQANIRSAMIVNIAKFVTWPEASPDGHVDICVSSDDPFLSAWNDLNGLGIGSQAVRVRAEKHPYSAHRCDIVYSPADEEAHVVPGRLTISDQKDFLSNGGMIAVYPSGNRMAFSINRTNVAAANINASSRLLQLAEEVFE